MHVLARASEVAMAGGSTSVKVRDAAEARLDRRKAEAKRIGLDWIPRGKGSVRPAGFRVRIGQ